MRPSAPSAASHDDVPELDEARVGATSHLPPLLDAGSVHFAVRPCLGLGSHAVASSLPVGDAAVETMRVAVVG